MIERAGMMGDLFQEDKEKADKIIQIFDSRCLIFEDGRREISIWHSTSPLDAGDTRLSRLETDKNRKIGGLPFKYFIYGTGGAGSFTDCEGFQSYESGTYWCFALCSYSLSGMFTNPTTGEIDQNSKRHNDQDEKNFQEAFQEIISSAKFEPRIKQP